MKIKQRITYIAIAGNILYILWIVYNGVHEGFRTTPVHVTAYIGILLLLATDSVLLFMKKR